jgi:hypothetical protein
VIVKVQMALASSGRGRATTGLVYEQSRKHTAEQPLPDAVVKLLRQTPNKKGFFHAEWTGTFWQIGAGAEYQEW